MNRLFKLQIKLFLIKILGRPFVWALGRKRQTIFTRTIRAAWRAL